MPELLNYNELSAVVASSPVTDGHAALLDALHARYPDIPFNLIAKREGRSWQPGIVDRDGNRVADSLINWVNRELADAGGDAREVWRRHKDSGLVRTEWVGSTLYLTAPYGPAHDVFHQLEVLLGSETTTSLMFDSDPRFAPEDRSDLLTGLVMVFGDCERHVLSPPKYKIDDLVNARRFLRELVEVDKADRLARLPEMERKAIHIKRVEDCEMLGPGEFRIDEREEIIPFLEMFPNWLHKKPPAARLFQDWHESSAGMGGNRFCDHWFIQTNDWQDGEGQRHLSIVPQWADADGGLDLPEISPNWDDSPYGVMESLALFDRQAGYSFAWYFYMLHGNRIGHAAGSVVAKAIKQGVIKPLPEWDEKVLLRWSETPYGF